MPRPRRTILQDVTYHCFTRCHGRKNLFNRSFVKQYFVDAINMCHEKYEFELIAAEPVDNHIHLVIRTLENQETISLIMQYIKSVIARKYNRRTGETGAFWNERYGCTIIEHSEDPENYLLHLLWYIGYNPVRKRLSSDPRNTELGFINCYLDKSFRCRVKITLHRYFTALGKTFGECVERFLFYEDAYRKRLAFFY